MFSDIYGSISPYVRYLGITRRDRSHLPYTHSLEVDNIFIYVLGGQGTHLVDGRLCPLHEGVLEIIPPCSYQTIMVTGDEPLAMLYIHFDWFETEESHEIVQNDRRKQTRRKIPERELMFLHRMAVAPADSRDRIVGLHRRLMELHAQNTMIAALWAKVCMLELIARFSESTPLSIPGNPSARTGHVAAAIRFIAMNFGDPALDHVRVAEFTGMNAGYLSRLIREQLGVPLSAYIRHVRISRAKEMLVHGERVTEAARRCGYVSLQAFSRAFRQHTGMPPRRWAKESPDQKNR